MSKLNSGNRTNSEHPWREFFHRLGKHWWDDQRWVGWDGTPFSMDPIHGFRVCGLCGKRQKFFYDSQGGSWHTVDSEGRYV